MRCLFLLFSFYLISCATAQNNPLVPYGCTSGAVTPITFTPQGVNATSSSYPGTNAAGLALDSSETVIYITSNSNFISKVRLSDRLLLATYNTYNGTGFLLLPVLVLTWMLKEIFMLLI